MKIFLHLVLFVALTALVAAVDVTLQLSQGYGDALLDWKSAAILAALLTLVVGQAEQADG